MAEHDAFVDRIRAVYPELTVTKARLVPYGWSNNVIVVNEQLVFRFPRHAAAIDTLMREVAILRGLVGRTTLPVPDPIYTAWTPWQVGQVFMGYRLIPGQPLWRQTFAALDDATGAQVARQLGTFLRELHGVPVAKAIAVELPLLARRERWTDMYRHIRERLFPAMRPMARRRAAQLFETFLADPDRFDFQPVLTHRDFGTSNILVDGTPPRVSGIIDFGAAGLADPAADCAGIMSAYGEPFLHQFLAVYPELETAFERARFYVKTFPLQEALAGAERGDAQALKRGLVTFR